jgi:hypothetical protein
MPAGTIALGSAIISAIPALAAASPFLVGLATQTAIGLALYALSAKGKGISGGYQVTANGSALDHQIIYGRTKVAGARVFDHTTGTNNVDLHRVLVFAGHEIDAFEEIYINGYKVTSWGTGSGDTGEGNVATIDDGEGNTADTRYSGKVEVYKHLGADNQTVDTVLKANIGDTSIWGDNHRLRGLAYLYVKFTYDADTFRNGVPEVKALIRGKKLYDPRTDSRSWSDNPALCIRDYLRSGSIGYAGSGNFGLGEDPSEVDGAGTFSTAADVCDETVAFNGDVNTRYTCNGAFTTDVTPVDILQTMLTSCAGLLWYAQGEWRLKAGSYSAPTVTLTEDDFIGPISVSTRHSRRDNFNGVRGTYKGSDNEWQFSDYPPLLDEDAVTEDGGQPSYSDLDLLFTDNEDETQRLAQIALRQNRQQITVQADFGLKAFKLQIGDTVGITNSRFGWTNKAFEVNGWSFKVNNDLTIPVSMTLREINAEVYEVEDIAGSWDISNASYTTNSFDVDAASSDRPEGVFLKPDGTKMYISGPLTDSVIEYDLSTAWDVSTASQVASYDVSAEDGPIYDVFFKPDGTKMYTVGNVTDSIYEYTLSTAWNVTTSSYSGNSYDLSTAPESEAAPRGIFFNFDGTRMYATGSNNDSVYQYNLGTPWDLSSASHVRTLDVSAQEAAPESVHFKFDGTKMYIMGGGGADVNEYDLSDAWNISTATFSQNFSVSAQDTQPRGLFIRSNGTKMYVSGAISGSVHEYDILA